MRHSFLLSNGTLPCRNRDICMRDLLLIACLNIVGFCISLPKRDFLWFSPSLHCISFFFWQLTIYWKALVGLPLVFCLGAFVFHNHISLTSHSHLNIFVMHKFVRNCCLIFSSNPHCTPKPHSLPAMRPRWRVTYLWLIYVETFLAVSEPHNHNTDVEYIIWLELKRYRKKWI